jgi:hypothetical protein
VPPVCALDGVEESVESLISSSFSPSELSALALLVVAKAASVLCHRFLTIRSLLTNLAA